MTKKITFIIFAVLCISVGLYPLMYFIVDRTFGLLDSKSDLLLQDVFWNIGFYTHILLGGLALLIGWIQFSKAIRIKNLKLHRAIGKVYTITVLLSGLASLYIACFATGGWITMLGFMVLGIVWLYTTFMGYSSIKVGNVSKHQKFMIYSYAACFAAVTLRIWLPTLMAVFQDFLLAYRIVAWLCWVPNIIIAYWIVKHKKLNRPNVS
ncbi:DUF2306 domain-containing protein [uncultured Psychroserpens sp.]|uniref:DUF2306 domain-containing protein n=1 Tax=uncultured Psychroserpens sp. TaxID=255436 RepID=UPI0026159D49|nr:DUF2306 domain-containing protein [uncultured Psychroserpens sp.]